MLPSDEEETTERASVEDTLEYIADMLGSLEEMARRNELRSLADLIENAHGEARRQARKRS